jgi:hypothetical protein
VVRCVVNSLLNSTWPLNILGMISRPKTSKIFTINLNDFDLRICLFDLVVDMINMVMNFRDQIFGIKEAFSKIVSWLLARHWDFFWKEVSPSAISSDFVPTIIMNREVRSVDFLWSHPKNIRLVVALLLDLLQELIPGGNFDWWILFEGKLNLDLLFLHESNEFFYIDWIKTLDL